MSNVISEKLRQRLVWSKTPTLLRDSTKEKPVKALHMNNDLNNLKITVSNVNSQTPDDTSMTFAIKMFDLLIANHKVYMWFGEVPFTSFTEMGKLLCLMNFLDHAYTMYHTDSFLVNGTIHAIKSTRSSTECFDIVIDLCPDSKSDPIIFRVEMIKSRERTDSILSVVMSYGHESVSFLCVVPLSSLIERVLKDFAALNCIEFEKMF